MKTRQQVLKYQKKLKDNPTRSEIIALETLIKNNLLPGVDFLFQEVFAYYILDFVFPAKRLIIEIDGYSHSKTKLYDQNRDLFCEKHGFSTIRIPNHKAHTIFIIYSQYCKVSRSPWEKLKKSAEDEYFNKNLTNRRKPLQKRKRKSKP